MPRTHTAKDGARTEPLERLNGSVERVTFHSEDTGFSVLRVRVRGLRELVTVVGSAASVGPGEYLECHGWWVNDAVHGRQFKARHMHVIAPSTLAGIEKYLGSGMVKGIGPHFARKLVKAFGERVFEVIEKEPDRLTTLEGIGPKRRQKVVDAWKEQKAVREIMVFLRSHGLGTARAVRIYKTYGDEAVQRVRENPYRLALDIHGMGFKSADALAENLGIPRDSVMRAQAGLRHVLQELSSEGHCAAEREDLVTRAGEILGISPEIIGHGLDAALEQGDVITDVIDGKPCVFLSALYRAELGVASHLARLMDEKAAWGSIDAAKALPWAEEKTGLTLSPSQRRAVDAVINGKLTVITGGPGVGKTTVVNSILRILKAKRALIALCAPTGRAAKRLTESTGMEAKTIHRMLEFDPKLGRFRRDAAHPLLADLLVVDEISMVDVVLMNQLLRALPTHCALLMVGDADQLPSVGPGAVLFDVIESGRVEVLRLQELFRQASTSKIIVNAHRINRGEMPERHQQTEERSDFYFVRADEPAAIQEKLLHMATERIPKGFGIDPVRDLQVLTPMNRGPLGTAALNMALQKRLTTEVGESVTRFGWTYACGDKVVQTVNNYDKDVFNGDVGIVARVDTEDNCIYVTFDGREVPYEFGELDELSLAYAMTIHKSQGSEYPAVLIPMSTQHYTLLQRNLLYTAVTRGRRLVVIVGQPKALAMAVKQAPSRRRLTVLAQRLKQSVQPPLSLESDA